MSDVDYLYEPSGAELHWDGLKKQAPPQEQSGGLRPASLVSAHPDDVQGMMSTTASAKAHAAPPAPPPVRQITPDELMAKAQAMLAAHKIQAEAQIGAGPSVGDRDDAGSLLPDWLKGAAGR